MDNNRTARPRREGWYNRGWELRERPVPGGKPRREWVYTGPYYDLQPFERRLRLRVGAAVSAVLAAGVWLALALTKGVAVWAAYPCVLGAVPLLYYCMGAFWLACTSGPMTFRRYHASVLRMRAAAWGGLGCMGLTAVGQMVSLLTRQAEPLAGVLFLAGTLLCAGQYALGLSLLRRAPFEQSGGT